MSTAAKRLRSAALAWLTAAFLGRLSPPAVALLTFLIAGFVAVSYASPISDGDLFWHLAYARQIVEHGTLKPDATLYSWTPTSNAMIYCAWLSELCLYGLWQLGGFPAIFGLRYLIVVAVIMLVCSFARSQKVLATPGYLLCLLLLIALIAAGALPKPEMFSLLFFTGIVTIYIGARTSGASRYFFLVPGLLLVWVNCHGGFILISPFLALTAVGEIGLVVARASAGLQRRAFSAYILAWILCVGAIFATPYGLAYPVALFDENILGAVARPDVRWNSAYLPIFDGRVSQVYVFGLAAMILALGVLAIGAWRRRRAQAFVLVPLGLALLPYAVLYVKLLRTTQYLPILFAFLAIGLAGMLVKGEGTAAKGALPARLSSVAVFIVGACAIGAIVFVWLHPPRYDWIGFGISNGSPVAEAEFLARQPQLGPRLYNTFDSGGYLLWRLYPSYKVMTDSRSFPYLSWFEDQYEFTNGREFDTFLKKYPADVAIIDLSKQALWSNFFKAKDWRLAFYGRSAAVFVHQDDLRKLSREPTDSDPERFADLRSYGEALNVFEFSTFFGDYASASIVLELLDTKFKYATPVAELERDLAYRDAILAIRIGDYAKALELLQHGTWQRTVSDRDRIVLTLLTPLVRNRDTLDPENTGKIVAALKQIVPPGF